VSNALGIVLLVAAGVLAIAIAVAHSLLADEIRAWLPYLGRRLIRSAARHLPVDTQASYERDWLAELAAWEDRPLSALAKAVHIRWKVGAIRESLGGASIQGDRTKRVFDLCSAMVALFLLGPLLVATAIAIKLESRGPVFFRQPRTGRDNKSFRLIKFRSMYIGEQAHRYKYKESYESDGVMFKIHGDPRITRVGRFLRRTSLDELPQLLNVLKGDMSLVGPRPLIPADEISIGDQNSGRLDVRPGLTGPRQIETFEHAGETPPEGDKLDEEYARSRSLLLDIRLLLRTVCTVLFMGRSRRSR
jgi:lipopolysaccharide/colanic/teichoic acid biosynthesis glycosyltransferase